MKVLFAGPSLHGADVDLTGIDLRPPARQGDVIAAVREGATAIGLVDGYFGGAPAVWHKEILYALSLDITVFGAASMGALRAAECAVYGMVPVGRIADDYVSGRLDDDAAVALVHAPPEFGSEPMSEPLVDAEATLAYLLDQGFVTVEEGSALLSSARRCFFGDRTADAIAAGAGLAPHRTAEFVVLYAANRVPLKQRDALLLVERLRSTPDHRVPTARRWRFAVTPMWRQLFEGVTPV